MFKETDNGQTQYCPMCEEWRRKYELLENKLNEKIRKNADTIYEYAIRMDEYHWDIIDWKIIEQAKQILQIIDEVE